MARRLLRVCAAQGRQSGSSRVGLSRSWRQVMGIFDALTTAVSGLQAQSFALQNISGNIANSQTTGYKETDTYFEDLVSDAALGSRPPAESLPAPSPPTPCRGRSRARRSRPTWPSTATAGSWCRSRSARPTISQCSAGSTTIPAPATFSSTGRLSRQRRRLLPHGYPARTGDRKSDRQLPQVLQFTNDFVPAQETTAITYQANLPSAPTGGMLNANRFRS